MAIVEKRSTASKCFDIFNVVLLGLLTLLTLYPMYYILVCSVSDYTMLNAQEGLVLFPVHFNLTAYKAVFRDPMILPSYGNTLLYVSVGTTLQMLMTINGAYILSRRGSFILAKPLNLMIVVTMFFTGGLIPTYMVVRDLSLLDSMWALILPYAINTWNLILMRNSFEAVPEALLESAKIDGANDFQTLMRIVLPVSLPILAVICLYYLVENWNAWFPASIYLQNRERYPLQLILREILIVSVMDTSDAGSYGEVSDLQEIIKYAAIVVATAPVLCVYPFLQKYFVKGVMVGAVKG